MLHERRQWRALGQPAFEMFDLLPPHGGVLVGEGDVAAGQGLALGMVAQPFEGALTGPFAQGSGRIMDAGDVGAGIDRGVVAAHDPPQSAVVEDDGALEAGSLSEVLQAMGGFGGGRAGQVGVLVGVDNGQEMFTAGQGLFAFDLGSEAGLAGA